MYKYKDIVFEDIDEKIEEGFNDWSGICQSCVDEYHVDVNKLDDGGSGCCMVLNCPNRADYYIDFNDGEITKITL